MRHFSEETRRAMSEAAKKRCTEEWRKNKSNMYETKLDTEKISEMYENGMTQTEIAEAMGVSQKVIWRHMKNHGIKSRVAKKRNQNAENNSLWKGDEASYSAFHLRVETAYGKAKEYPCSLCGEKNKEASYDWANLTGNYQDINDYAPMCRKCHRRYDNMRKRRWLKCRMKQS